MGKTQNIGNIKIADTENIRNVNTKNIDNISNADAENIKSIGNVDTDKKNNKEIEKHNEKENPTDGISKMTVNPLPAKT